MTHTIIAQATPHGKSGVAVIRISGAKAKDLATLLCPDITLKPRYAHYATLKHPQTQEILDYALLLYFSAPHSFTGEDVLEIQCHGSKAVIASIIQLALTIADIRYAEAGEFTRRALENGKLDLLQIEALADLIDAETPKQQRLATRQLSGIISTHYQTLEKNIIEARAFCEVFIDFPDDDLPDDLNELIDEKIAIVRQHIENMLQHAASGIQIKDGVQVAIIGLPNAGKSTLLNAIAGRQVAITSSLPGTTRDALELYVDLEGTPFRFFDTAGVRDTSDDIEKQGVTIAIERAGKADIVIMLLDGSRDISEQLDVLNTKIVSRETILVVNKTDLLSESENQKIHKNVSRETICISAKENTNLETLLNALKNFVQKDNIEDVYVTRMRHITHLNNALVSLQDALTENDLVIKSQHLIYATNEISAIVGNINVERILDALFSSFCIGK